MARAPSQEIVVRALAVLEALHRRPELSGEESATAGRIVEEMERVGAEPLLRGVGGHGVVACFNGEAPGPRVLLRCELDALPIAEDLGLAYASEVDGVAHLCGHDGHMAILVAVAGALAEKPPLRGSVCLLFQPAEETGEGAAAVLRDPAFAQVEPDFAFALHNLPGFELGSVVVREGTFCCASRGLAVTLEGRPAHAAQPETGRSPSPVVGRLLGFLEEAGRRRSDTSFATVVGASMGAPAFGTAPGSASVWVTLRGETDAAVDLLQRSVENEVARLARDAGLAWRTKVHDDFPATVNDSAECRRVVRVADGRAATVERPLRWSEDFGRLLQRFPGALVGLGSGTSTPDLHDPAFRFPTELVGSGAELLLRLVDDVLSGGSGGPQGSSAR